MFYCSKRRRYNQGWSAFGGASTLKSAKVLCSRAAGKTLRWQADGPPYEDTQGQYQIEDVPLPVLRIP